MVFPGDSGGKESACNAGDLGWSLDLEDAVEKGIATHSSQILISHVVYKSYVYTSL